MFCSTCGAQSTDVDRFCPNCGAALAASLNVAAAPAAQAAAQTAFPAQVYAGFWIRVAAALIDWIAIGILNALISAFLTPVVGVLTSLLSGWLYHALLESSENQATFGKMAVGVYVTDLNGQRISFGQATLRHFAK